MELESNQDNFECWKIELEKKKKTTLDWNNTILKLCADYLKMNVTPSNIHLTPVSDSLCFVPSRDYLV